MTYTTILIAYAAGIDAAVRNASRAPCQSKVVMDIIRANNGPIGGPQSELTAAVMSAFSSGYQDQCNAEASTILAA